MNTKSTRILTMLIGIMLLASFGWAQPDFKFVEMRYAGTKATGDQDKYRFNSILKFSVSSTPIQSQNIENIKKELWEITLFPWPLKRIEAHLIYTDAFGIKIDHQRVPDLMTQIDINSGIPPAYAALAVYCFDFNNEIRDDLFAQKIKIRAIGVGRGIIYFLGKIRRRDF